MITSPAQSSSLKAIRSAFLHFVADPFYAPEADCVRYFSDGLLILENGRVKELDNYASLKQKYAGVPIVSYPDRLIVPGFIDLHIHFPQTEMIAAYGAQLLEWLDKYTFPTEQKFNDKAHAEQIAEIFLNELLRNGTTTAVVLAAVYPESVDALFAAAKRRNLRLIAGKVMMDRHAPAALTDTAASSYEDSKALIQKWHRHERLLYAVTPRFAATSTEEQLQIAGQLIKEYPDVYLHTHLAENVNEVAWIKELFPDRNGYLDVYDYYGLVGERSIFAHGVQLTEAEFERLSAAQSTIAFCPTSNLFLGSGLFKIERAKAENSQIKLGLATDVGAGTSFSMLQTANEAYKIAQLRQQNLSAFQALFLSTLGAARSLCLEDTIGNFEAGKEADFIVLNPQATPIMKLRNPVPTATTIEELSNLAFSLIMMGDDRTIEATYIMGELTYEKLNDARLN